MFALLLVAAAVQLGVWLLVFRPALLPDAARPASPTPPVSVVVCFRNEAPTLAACLRSLLDQDYPDFEIIAVDDNSTDRSAEIARKFSSVRVIPAGETNPGKRDALAVGIAAARHELVLLTDADCTAASPDWMRRMTAPLTGEAEVVLGCGPLRGGRGPVAAWQRFEATYVALQYQGFARRGFPYMAVGRNLAYRQSFFRRAGTLTVDAPTPGGDDDLIVGYTSRPRTTARVTDPTAWTYSAPVATLGGYLRQKLRHQAVGLHYRGLHQALLVGVALSHGLFYLCGFVLLFTERWEWALVAYALRAVAVVATYARRSVRLFLGAGAGSSFVWKIPTILVGDLLYSFHYVFLLGATFSNRQSW